MDAHSSPVTRSERGFTLIEIGVAVALLGLAFTTLIGLQTMYADRAVIDRNLTQAALATQYILTGWESARVQPDPGENNRLLSDELSKLGYFQDLPEGAFTEDSFSGWSLNSSITSIDIFDRKDALRRVELAVRWGEHPSEEFSVIYFMRVNQRGRQN